MARKSKTHYAFALQDWDGNTVEGSEIKLPSVTTILSILNKPGLDWWGWNLGMKGTLEFLQRELTIEDLDVHGLREGLMKEKLAPNHELKRSGQRGTRIHGVFEAWVKNDGWLPEIEDDNPDAGYFHALCDYLKEEQPEIVETEQPVWSLRHGYAGTLDAVTKSSDVLDLKTQNNIDTHGKVKPLVAYDNYHLQVEAYAHAREEMGVPINNRAIVVLGASGDYKVFPGQGSFEQFLAVKNCWEHLQQLKEDIKSA